MRVNKEIPGRLILDRLAEENGVAIAIVDRSAIETLVANNNSICRSLNPDGELVGECMAFCGKALDIALDFDESINYTCHAGLECRADAMLQDGREVAAVVGRTFVKSEDYRRATTRAISGDWQNYSPAVFFENVLLTGSASVLDSTLEEVSKLSVEIAAFEAETPIETLEPELEIEIEPGQPKEIKPIAAPEQPAREITRPAEQYDSRTAAPPAFPDATNASARATGAKAWRSFFGSLLNQDYTSASHSILEFLAKRYGLTSLVWLERRDARLENVAVFGDMQQRRVRLGIAPDDPRLAAAVSLEMPVELNERSAVGNQEPRKMYLFPVPVGRDIPAALAVLDAITDDDIKHQIARLCHSVAPRLEILRLRSEVSSRDTLVRATRKFSESLREIDAVDFWLRLTQASAELLQAERASLITHDIENERYEIKAAIGAGADLSAEQNAGGRVARIVFEKGKPVIVSDVTATGLPPLGGDRHYKTRSFISAPVTLGTRPVAVLNFTDKASGVPFDRHDLDLIRAITPQIAVAIDRALLKEKAGEFQQLSVTDALTGLLNRRYIEQRLAEEVKRSTRHGYPMSFIMLDVDNFKSYNDNFGHPAGDEALKIVATIVKDTLRGADVAARFGGEEFAILLPQTTDVEASAIAERVRHSIDAADFPERKVTISVGVASCSSELCSTKNMIAAADKALYRAKNTGRNRVCIFEEMENGGNI